jgi:hypothetical protein
LPRVATHVDVKGERFLVAFEIERYAFPDSATGWQGNSLAVRVQLDATQRGHFRAEVHSSDFLTTEFAAFRDQLRSLLRTLSGEAAFQHSEGNVEVNLALGNGKGSISATVRGLVSLGPELVVTGFDTDQSYLAETLRQLDDAVQAFPVRGDLYG